MKPSVQSISKAKEADHINFGQISSQAHYRSWKTASRKKVAAAAVDPSKAFQWYCKVDDALSSEELEDSEGQDTLDMKIAAAFINILHGELRRKIDLEEEKLALQRKLTSPHR